MILAKRAGVVFQAIPYQGGGGTCMPDLLTGRYDFAMGSIAYFVPQIAAGKLRPLAVGGLKRSVLYPNVPTLAETYPGFGASSWFGVIAPSGVPKALLDRYEKALQVAVQSEPLRSQLIAEGFIVEAMSGTEFRAKVRGESERLGAVIKEMDLSEK